MTAKAYSFIDVSATLTGPTGKVQLGYGAATEKGGISINANNDKNALQVAADGTPMNSLRADNSGTVTVKLLKISPANAILMQMYDAQKLSSALWGQNVIIVNQSQVGDLHTCTSCAFKRKPNVVYDTDGEMMEWTFDAGVVYSVMGTY